MPKLDGTGPEGQGSMTGQGMGNCGAGGLKKRFLNCRWKFFRKEVTKDEEIKVLKQNAQDLKEALEGVESRISELGK